MSEDEIKTRTIVGLVLALATIMVAIGMSWIGFLAWTLSFAFLSFIRYAWRRNPS